MNPILPNKWHYVYLLASNKTRWIYPAPAHRSWIYIGCNNNLNKSLKEHDEGEVYSTKKMLPVQLIYFEGYRSKDYAFKREKNLKTYGSGLANLKTRLGILTKGRAG